MNQQEMFEGIPKTPRKNYLGVDPGVDGGIALILTTGEIYVKKMPSIGASKKTIVEAKLRAYLMQVLKLYPNTIAILEEVSSVYGSSAGSNFKFGWSCGLAKGMLSGVGFPIEMLRPKAWQKEIWINQDKVLKQNKRVDTKKTSMLAAQRLFPTVNLLATSRSRVPHDGMVDALLLAEAGRRLNL